MYAEMISDQIVIPNGKNLRKTIDENANKKTYKWDIVWINVILITALHVGALYSIYLRIQYGIKWKSIIFVKLLAMSSGFGITAGAHRLWCHKSYKANKFCEILLMLMVSTVYQNSIYDWCRDHRVHHKYSDTDADPHNSNRGFFFSHVGWLFVRKHKDVIEKGKNVDFSDLEANPLVMFQHRYYYLIVFSCSIAIPVLIMYYMCGESFAMSFFVIGVYRTVVILNVTWSINSVAHTFGTKPYDTNIIPTENLPMQYLSFGEGFHNFHHTFPWDYRTGELSRNGRNATACLIDLFAYLGMVTDRKMVKTEIVQKKADKTGDAPHHKTIKNLTKIIFNITYVNDCIHWFFFLLLYICA